MSKLKVKKEVIEQLQLLINSGFGYDNKIHLLEEHMKVITSYGDEVWDSDEYPLLNTLSFSDMYNILHDNYEIEISAEDSIINRYNYEKKALLNSKELDCNWYESRGITIGMVYVLSRLGRDDIVEQLLDGEGVIDIG